MTNKGNDSATAQIVVCGSIAIDRIMNFKGQYKDLIKPDKLDVLSISVLLDKLENNAGGIGPNITVDLAHLGEKPVLLGSIGHDGKDYMSALEAEGVDVSYVHYSDLPTASFNVMTDSDNNQVGGFYQGAMSDASSLSFAPFKDQNVLAVICAHNPEGMNRQVQECKEMGIRLAYDPSQQVINDATDLKAGAEVAEIIIVNDYELSMMCQKIGITAEELKKQVPIIITTLGNEGSVIEGNKVGSPVRIGIAKVEAIDPTGAGDAYRAGFLYGYVRQWDLKKCGQLGATVASFIIEHHGTQHPFTRQDVMDRYKLNFNEEIIL